MSDTAKAPSNENRTCNWTGCGRAPHSQLGERWLCLDHFFEFSYRRMNVIRRVVDDRDHNRELLGDAHVFLSEVVAQTTQLATQIRLLDPKLRDQLLVLSTSAAELFNQVRRDPRVPRRIGCLLRLGMPASEISEQCCTVNISQRGACLQLSFPQRAGREVILERLDTRQSARAKIAWVKDTSGDRFLAGVKTLDAEDFWGFGPVAEASPSVARTA